MSSGKFNESKPTSFEPIKRNALATFDLETKNINGREKYEPRPAAFQWFLTTNKNVESDVERYDSADPRERSKQESRVRDGLLEIIDDLGLTARASDLEIVRYSENAPRISGRQLEPNRVPSNIDRVAQRGTYLRRDDSTLDLERVKQSGALTVDTVRDQIAAWAGRHNRKMPYYLRFLDHLIDNRDRGFRPTVLVDDIRRMRRAGFSGVTELLNDFGEIAGPVGLLSASINGNAVRVLPDFFRVGNNKPTTEELMREATIHFHASQGHMLVDSYIEYRGRVMRVSSKNAGEELSGGQGASVDGIFHSLQEINSMPEARKRFQQLIGSGKYDATIQNLRLVARVFEDTEGSRDNMRGYLAQFELVNTLNRGSLTDTTIGVGENDRRILKLIWDAAGSSDVGMNEFKHLIGAALGNRPDRDQILDTGVGRELGQRRFTPEFARLLRSFNLNRWGEPGISGVEKFSYEPAPGVNPRVLPNAKRGWWRRLKKALVYRVSRLINSDPNFSVLCTWILNHGAFCQIDTRYSLGGDDKNQLVVTNISATWPSNRVDSVRLMPLPSGEGFRYKLDINGGRGGGDESKIVDTDIDYDFGFKTQRDRDSVKRRMLPTQLDLARNKGDWTVIEPDGAVGVIPDTRPRKQSLRASRSSLILKGLFNDLAEMGYTGHLPEPDYIDREMRDQDLVQAYATPSLELAQRIVAGQLDSRLRNGIRYSINALWGMPVSPGFSDLFENDDDEEEETVGQSEVDRMRYYQIAQRHATIAKTIANMFYYSGRVGDALTAGLDRSDPEAWKDRVGDLQRWVLAIRRAAWPEFEAVIRQRQSARRRDVPLSIGVGRRDVPVATSAVLSQPSQARARGRPRAENLPNESLPQQSYTLRARINNAVRRGDTWLGRWYTDLPSRIRDRAVRQLTSVALDLARGGGATWQQVYDQLDSITSELTESDSRQPQSRIMVAMIDR